ncbi:hypothetical protein B484DRAFT_450584 [Ochromonadaceae sp. CCMP2298]|nr:hypothetical protein B484DRAFT_450584 [Ochromonadaceae sp. CCMP2298]
MPVSRATLAPAPRSTAPTQNSASCAVSYSSAPIARADTTKALSSAAGVAVWSCSEAASPPSKSHAEMY